ncbi:hypothetical protein ACFSJY_16305 [Thalassotalea euphylliae]|uniref:hypothetical protein n=1 Tax=Thalassotalea euphylliae TaxID=1655234 RepID=UPI003634A417
MIEEMLKQAGKKSIGMLMLLCVSACSSPTVHLYAKYLDDETEKQVVQQLEEQEFHVEVNRLNYPEMVNQSSIIYSPFVSQKDTVHALEAFMNSQHWTIGYVSALKEGNHWFQKDTIGLFLVPENVQPHSGKNMEDLALTYKSQHCASDINLSLARDGRYRFSKAVKNDKYSYGTQGHWRMRSYPYVELKPLNKGRWLYFEVAQSVSQDQLGEAKLYTLKPLEGYAGIEGCTFEYGERT